MGRRNLLALAACAVAAAAAAETPTWTALGIRDGERFGAAAAPAGDVDGDGFADVAIGAPFLKDDGAPNPTAFGRIQVSSGATGQAIWSRTGTQSGDRFGYAMLGVGDVDLDGFPDVAAGSPSRSTDFVKFGGVIGVYSGTTAQLLYEVSSDQNTEHMGSALCSLGDVDGDGSADFVGGAPNGDLSGYDSGYARVYSARTGAALATAFGTHDYQYLGGALCALGDVNGDSVEDFAAGIGLVPSVAPVPGSVLVFDVHGTLLKAAAGTAPEDAFGLALAPAGDLDHDTVGDLWVGIPGLDAGGAGAGAVQLLSGTTLAPLATLHGQGPGMGLGIALSQIGDVDGDGKADFAAGGASGRAELRSSATYAVLFAVAGGKELGRAVAGLGDVDQDGLQDVAIGEPEALDFGGATTGALHVYPQAQIFGGDLALADSSPLALAWTAGEPAPSAVRMLANAGNSALTWIASVEPGSGWLSASPSAGVLAPGASAPITLTAEPTGLPAGSYGTAVTFANAAEPLDAAALQVGFAVTGGQSGPLCLAGPSAALFEFAAGAGAPAPHAMLLQDCSAGGAPLAFAGAASQSWITLAPDQGEIPPGGSAEISIAVDAPALGPGLHQGTVRIENLAEPANAVEILVVAEVGLPHFEPGTRLVGQLGGTDVDAAVFTALKGMKLELELAPTSGDLRAQVSIRKAGGAAVASFTLPHKGTLQKRRIKLKSAGLYELRLAADGATAGGYDLATARVLPKNALPRTVSGKKPKAGVIRVAFAALPGTLLDASVLPKGVAPEQLTLALADPAALPIELAGFAASGPGMLGVAGVPLAQNGLYQLLVAGFANGKQKAAITLAPAPPEAGSGTLALEP